MTDVVNKEPTLIVGLGGAGGQTLARIKDLVEQAAGGVPPAMSFLYLDTFDAIDPSVRRVLDRHRDFLNISNFNPREWIEAQFNGQGPAAEDVRDWYDTSARAFVPYEHIRDGASRLRMLGRICLFKHRFEVEERIHAKIAEVLSGASELDQARPLEGAPRPLRILLVSGSCGGTGSGTFLDVLYMLNRAAVVDFHLAPQTNTFLFLPDLFIRLNQRISEMNVPLYQSNGWAFLDELDYFIKNPSQLNEWAMDSRSADRRPHPIGTGLPAGVELVSTAFLIDAKIPNVGLMERPRDLFAFAARAIFQSQLAPTSGSVASFFSNVKSYLLERDAQRNRPKRYAALGYAELRYPRNVFEQYLGMRYKQEAIERGLLARNPEVLAAVPAAARAWAKQLLGEQLAPVIAELEKLRARALESLPGPASFETDDDPPRIDAARVAEDALRTEVTDTLAGVDRAVSALRVKLSAERARMTRAVADDVDRRIDTAAGGLGLPYLLDLLATTDAALEAEHAELARTRSPEALDARAEEAKAALLGPEGALEQLARAGRSFFGRERAVRQRLSGFFASLRAVVEARFDAELTRARLQLFKAICGDPEDRDPVLETYDERTGTVTGTEVVRSVLDRGEDTVITAMNVHLATWAGMFHVDQLAGKLFKTDGDELTTRYVVPAASMEQLRDNPFLDELFARGARLGPGEVAGEITELLARARQLGLRLSELREASYEPGRLEPLARALDERSRERFREGVDRSVLDVVAGFDEQVREKLLADLAHASIPAITVDDGLLDPVADQLVRIRVVSAERPEHAAYLKNESFSVVPGTRDRFCAQQSYYAFPLYAVRGVLGLQQAYLNRDRQRNFPHIHRRFNERGLPESLGQETFAASDAALLTFARARAISEHVLENRAVLARLEGKLELVRERFGEVERVALVDHEKRDGSWVTVLHAIDQDPDRRIRFRVHSPLELGVADLRANLASYSKAASYLQSHRRFVDSLEILEGELGLTFASDAYSAYLAQIEREIAEARARKEDNRVRVLLAMGRLLDAHTRALERERSRLEPL